MISISGTFGAGEVHKYNARTGTLIWREPLPKAHTITHLTFYEEELYAYSNNSRVYQLDPTSGKILEIFTSFEDTNLNVALFFQPQWKGLVFQVYDSPNLGEVVAKDGKTDQSIWRSAQGVISNVAYTENSVYFLHHNGILQGVDIETGKEAAFAKFTPAPFILHGMEVDEDMFPRDYYVTAESESNVVVVYLGDSNQLFAFQEQE